MSPLTVAGIAAVPELNVIAVCTPVVKLVNKFVDPGVKPATVSVVDPPTFDVKSKVTLEGVPATAPGAEALKPSTDVPSVTGRGSVTVVVPAVNEPALIPKVCDVADPLTACVTVMVRWSPEAIESPDGRVRVAIDS